MLSFPLAFELDLYDVVSEPYLVPRCSSAMRPPAQSASCRRCTPKRGSGTAGGLRGTARHGNVEGFASGSSFDSLYHRGRVNQPRTSSQEERKEMIMGHEEIVRRVAIPALLAATLVLVTSVASALEPVFSTTFGEPSAGTTPWRTSPRARPVEGTSAHRYEWKGAAWSFASAENRAAFAADPEKYAPRYGGYCAWAVSQGYTASIDPDAWRDCGRGALPQLQPRRGRSDGRRDNPRQHRQGRSEIGPASADE